jgi:polysaccharide biosynthesis transport protein
VQELSTEAASEPGLDVRDLLYQLARQKWIILGVLVLITGATAVVTLSMDKIYEAKAVIEYDPTPPRPLGSNVEGVDNQAATFMLVKEWYQTQNRIIESRSILRRVVDRLGLHRDPDFMRISSKRRATWKGAEPDDAIDMLEDALKVVQEKETRIVRLEVEGINADKAALLANTIADTYISWVMEQRLGSTVNAVDWLSGQLDDTSKKLERSEMALHTFRRTNNVLSVSLNDQQNVVTEKIKQFSAGLSNAQMRRFEVAAELDELRAANRPNPFDAHTGVFANNGSVATLREKYETAVVDRDALVAKYGVNHPQMQAVQARIDSLTAEAHEQLEAMILAQESRLRAVDQVIEKLRSAKQQAQNEGLELTLQAIEYNQLERERMNNEKVHSLLLQRTTETNLTRMFQAAPVRVVDRATVMRSPVRPRLTLTVVLGAFVGLISGVGLAVLRTRMDRSIFGPDDIAAVRVDMLGLVPSIAANDRGLYAQPYGGKRKRNRPNNEPVQDKDLIVHTHPRSIIAECCRTIRTNLAFMSTDKPLRTLLVASPGPSEGKTTIAASMAITMAQAGRRTLLVDTDLRRPRVHKVFKLPMHLGVTRVLAKELEVEEAIQNTEIENLWVLPSGPIPPNPAELLQTERFAKLIEDLKARFDIVVFDSPPVGVVTDAAVLGPQLDGCLVVVRAEKSTRDTLANAMRALRNVKAHILGVVINEADLSRRRTYKGYYYGNYYALPENEGGGDDGGSGPSGSFPTGSPGYDRV